MMEAPRTTEHRFAALMPLSGPVRTRYDLVFGIVLVNVPVAIARPPIRNPGGGVLKAALDTSILGT